MEEKSHLEKKNKEKSILPSKIMERQEAVRPSIKKWI